MFARVDMNEFQAHELATMIWSHSSTLHATAWRGELVGEDSDPAKRYVLVGLDHDTDLVVEKLSGEWTFRLSRIVNRQQVNVARVAVSVSSPDDLEEISLAAIEVASRFFEGEFGPVTEDDAPGRALVLRGILQRLRTSRA